jgi:hypothetical protein
VIALVAGIFAAEHLAFGVAVLLYARNGTVAIRKPARPRPPKDQP